MRQEDAILSFRLVDLDYKLALTLANLAALVLYDESAGANMRQGEPHALNKQRQHHLRRVTVVCGHD